MTEYEKMLAGVWYYPGEEELAALHQRAVALCYAANHLPPEREEERMELLRPLFGKTGAEFTITPDFHCDYGGNITLGEGFYANYNLVILDCARLRVLHRHPPPGRRPPGHRGGEGRPHHRGQRRVVRRERHRSARGHHRRRGGDRRGQRGHPRHPAGRGGGGQPLPGAPPRGSGAGPLTGRGIDGIIPLVKFIDLPPGK